MPRYFFHVDDVPNGRDEVGVELADLDTARCEAVKAAAGLICDNADKFWVRGEWGMTVTNKAGLTLFSLVLVGFDAAASGKPSTR